MELSSNDQNKIVQLFAFLGISQDQINISTTEELVTVVVRVDENEAGRYIGRYASTIDSIQLLISLMLNQNYAVPHRHVLVDIGGYRERRSGTLKDMVDRIAAEVLATGSPRALPPISSTERREVHIMFSEHDKLTTYSQGDGPDRRLYIALRQ